MNPHQWIFWFLFFVSFQSNAQSALLENLEFFPNEQHQEVCAAMGFSGLGNLTLKADGKVILTSARGEKFQMRKTAENLKHQSSSADLEGIETTVFSVSIHLQKKIFEVHDVTLDGRGHLRAKLTCSGRIR